MVICHVFYVLIKKNVDRNIPSAFGSCQLGGSDTEWQLGVTVTANQWSTLLDQSTDWSVYYDRCTPVGCSRHPGPGEICGGRLDR